MTETPTQAELGRQKALFESVERVVAEPLKFKAKLAIGADAYLTMKIGARLQSLWDVGGVAASGAGVAASSTVAGTFFASGGWLSALGIGAAATTPIGWVLGAAAASGAAYYGVSRVFAGYGNDRIVSVPKFINTPIDVLGSKLFDLIAPLAIKVARMDNDYDPRERGAIVSYFVDDFGLDVRYAEAALKIIEENTTDHSLNELVESLAEFKKANPDCNYQEMCRDLVGFLREVAEADGKIDEREEMAIEKVEQILTTEGKFSISDVTAYLPRFGSKS